MTAIAWFEFTVAKRSAIKKDVPLPRYASRCLIMEKRIPMIIHAEHV
jgi:hypothetical protein